MKLSVKQWQVNGGNGTTYATTKNLSILPKTPGYSATQQVQVSIKCAPTSDFLHLALSCNMSQLTCYSKSTQSLFTSHNTKYLRTGCPGMPHHRSWLVWWMP